MEEMQQKSARSLHLYRMIHELNARIQRYQRLLRTQAKTPEEITFLKTQIETANTVLQTLTAEKTEINSHFLTKQAASLPSAGEPRRNNSVNSTTTRRWRCEGGICGWFSGSGKKSNTPAGTRGGNLKKLSKLRKTRSKKLKKTRSHRN